MLKINKCVILSKKIPQISWFRNYNYDGKCPPRYECKQPEQNEREKAIEANKKTLIPKLFICKPHKDFRIFRNIFFFICIPVILCAYVNVMYFTEEDHKRPKYVEYTYMRIRTKAFPWDPARTLFHNPDRNALPGGYETEWPEEDEYDPKSRYPCPVPKKI